MSDAEKRAIEAAWEALDFIVSEDGLVAIGEYDGLTDEAWELIRRAIELRELAK